MRLLRLGLPGARRRGARGRDPCPRPRSARRSRAPNDRNVHWPPSPDGGAPPMSAVMKALLTPASRLWLRLRLNEIGPLISFAGCGFFAWAFLALADEVREGETHALDRDRRVGAEPRMTGTSIGRPRQTAVRLLCLP